MILIEKKKRDCRYLKKFNNIWMFDQLHCRNFSFQLPEEATNNNNNKIKIKGHFAPGLKVINYRYSTILQLNITKQMECEMQYNNLYFNQIGNNKNDTNKKNRSRSHPAP